MKTLVKKIGTEQEIDLILYIGEENMNEPAFEYLNQQKRAYNSRISQFLAPEANIYTCTIGLKSTHANYYLE